MSEEGRQAQAALYGAPLGDILSRCGSKLGLNQSQLAVLLGISAPMLSQLVHAKRIKIGNPNAVHRLQVMHEAVADVERGNLTAEAAIESIGAAGSGDEFFTGTTRRTNAGDIALAIQSLFRQVASASQFLAAADEVAEISPEIAEILRTYGAGRADEAIAHATRHRG